MQADAYGMFLVHYPIALWLQYWLFDFNLPATVKAPIGFVLTVAFSWALTRALRQIPGASRCCRLHAVIASEAKQSIRARSMDCFVAALLAMTEDLRTPCRSCRPAASSRTRC